MEKFEVDLRSDVKFTSLCQDFINKFQSTNPAYIEANTKKDFINWKNEEFRKIDKYRDDAINLVKATKLVDLDKIVVHYPDEFFKAKHLYTILNF